MSIFTDNFHCRNVFYLFLQKIATKVCIKSHCTFLLLFLLFPLHFAAISWYSFASSYGYIFQKMVSKSWNLGSWYVLSISGMQHKKIEKIKSLCYGRLKMSIVLNTMEQYKIVVSGTLLAHDLFNQRMERCQISSHLDTVYSQLISCNSQ